MQEGRFKIFLCDPREMERFSLDLPRAVKRECALEVTCGCVWNLWLQAKFFKMCNLKTRQAMRNLTCGNQ